MNESPLDKPAKERKPRTYDKKVHGKRYGEIHKLGIKALANSGLSDSQIASENNVSISTVWRTKNDPELKDLDATEVNQIKEGLQKLSYKRSFQFLKSVDNEKIAKASLVQTMVGAKIGLEMGRLMEGLSTENINIDRNDSQIDVEIESKLAELERIKNARLVNATEAELTSTQGLATESTGLSANESGDSSPESISG